VEKARRIAESSPALVTVVAPKIGYDKAAKIAKKMLTESKTIKQALIEEGVVKPEEVDKIIDLLRITKGGLIDKT
ncbi:MAG: hypothetical protein QXG21_02615, partial [Candidatus Caldarchaeum sp.]